MLIVKVVLLISFHTVECGWPCLSAGKWLRHGLFELGRKEGTFDRFIWMVFVERVAHNTVYVDVRVDVLQELVEIGNFWGRIENKNQSSCALKVVQCVRISLYNMKSLCCR